MNRLFFRSAFLIWKASWGDVICTMTRFVRPMHTASRNSLDKAWYVGDIQGDYDATVKAGLDFIHAAYGFGTIAQTVPELEQFSDLPELMETLAQD